MNTPCPVIVESQFHTVVAGTLMWSDFRLGATGASAVTVMSSLPITCEINELRCSSLVGRNAGSDSKYHCGFKDRKELSKSNSWYPDIPTFSKNESVKPWLPRLPLTRNSESSFAGLL